MDLPLILSIMWAGVIFGASSVPGKDLPSIEISDKLIHFAVYLILGLLLSWWRLERAKKQGASIFQAVFLGSLYGITDELHQGLVSGRTPDPSDWVADSLGVFAGAVALIILINLYRRFTASG